MILEISLYDYKTCKKYYCSSVLRFRIWIQTMASVCSEGLDPERLRIMFYNQSADKQCGCCNYDRHCRKMDYGNFGEGSLCDLK